MLLSANRSVLLIVDVQEKLLPVMHQHDHVLRNTGILLQAAKRLNVPVIAGEQYPEGLGHTVPEIANELPASVVVEKSCFSCADEETILERLNIDGRDQIVIAGIEAHVCVLQTALGLREQEMTCCVVADATSSRTSENAALAIERMRAHGVDIASTEMVLFEWLHRAGTPEFKELSRLIR